MSSFIKSFSLRVALLVLLLAVMSSAVFAAAPVNVSLTPSSGTVTAGVKTTISVVYSDPDGYSNLGGCYLLINSSLSGLNSVYFCYSENLNRIYLRNDANTGWLGGALPGSSTVIENTRCKVYLAETTVVKSGNNVTINYRVEFKPVMAGKTNSTWMLVEDETKVRDGWDSMGTLNFVAANNAPLNVSVTPSSGMLKTNVKTTLTSIYKDLDGYANLRGVYLLLNTALSGANGVYLCYSENLNLLYLRNDANTAWLGGYAPGAAKVIENGYCKLYCAETTKSGSGSDLALNWKIELKPTMSKKQVKAWLTCFDDTDLREGYDQLGSYTTVSDPVNISVNPSSGNVSEGMTQTFSCVYSDPNGANDLKECWFVINGQSLGTYAGAFMYDAVANKIYRREYTNQWSKIGGYAPGSPCVIETKYCRLFCADTTVSKSGNYLTVNWKIDLKPRVSQQIFDMLIASVDIDNLVADWTDAGDITVAQTTNPVTETFTPFSGPLTGGVPLTFTSNVYDRDGYANIAGCYVLFNTSINGANAAYVYYDANTNKLYLRNDAGTGWLEGFAPGTANVIENANCKLYCADTTVQGTGNKLTVNWKVEFKPAMAGKTCKVYLLAIDKTGKRDGWDQMGFYSGSGVLGDIITTETGLQYKDIEIGTGSAPAIGDKISVHYTGTLTNGTKFDSSYDRGTPFDFEVGMGKVIVGWDEALPSMRIGGKRILTIPPELAYGSQANGDIPANSTLIFDTQLMGIVTPAQ